MVNIWKVKWRNNEYQNGKITPFNSRTDAQNWIKCQQINNNIEPEGFEVIEGPYKVQDNSLKLWCDAKRPAPIGFILIKSVEYFTDYFIPSYRHRLNDIQIISIDTTPDKDNNLFSDLFIYFDNIDMSIKFHIHGNDADNKTKFLQLANNTNQIIVDNINESLFSNMNSNNGIKLWIDDIRPAPTGYIWIKSVNDFIDYLVEHGINDILVFDFDHDAGDYQYDGGDYIKCLDYLEQLGADNINIRLHDSNSVAINNMRNIIRKNQWNEVYDIYDHDASFYDENMPLDEAIEDIVDQQQLDEVEDTTTKSNIVNILKKASKDFQNAASNNQPEQFAKIVVAFDDLIGGVGKYDFKKKIYTNSAKNKSPKDITKKKKS